MKQIILGTAGHIDHGKTSLIKAVTGIDTDRLKEEKQRGITIELGFASLDLSNGQHLGIVDVPGHEKFVKNMVAGATGIDIVLMVIAADEGVMPQTREHMEICTLLGVQHGFVALTKIDMVDEEWLELAIEDVRDFTRNTFLEDAPIVPVSSVSGDGLDQFRDTLNRISTEVPERSRTTLFRLPIDRVFTMKGFGTVITGTLVSGRVKVGEDIMIYPTGIQSKVRGLQVHNESVEEAGAGMRTAINFQGLEKSAVNRGQVLSKPGALQTSYMIDVAVNILKSNKKAIKNRTLVRFHTGTSEILGNLVLLDRDEVNPGDAVVAQMRLDEPVALVKDDRFVIRSYSPVRTIGGGTVLNPIPPKHKRFKADIIEGLSRMQTATPELLVELHAEQAAGRGVGFSELGIMTNATEKNLDKIVQNLLSKKTLVVLDREARQYIHENTLQQIRNKLLRLLGDYHQKSPLKAGMPKEELKSKLPPNLSPKLFNLCLQQMVKSGDVVQEEDNLRLTSHKVSLGADQKDIRKKLLDTYRNSGLQPPYFKEVVKTFKLSGQQVKDVLMLLLEEGQIIKVKEDLYFDTDTVASLQKRLVQHLKDKGEITTPQFKEMTGASRKYVIPLIEYFDAKNVTIRIGDIRKLRRGS